MLFEYVRVSCVASFMMLHAKDWSSFPTIFFVKAGGNVTTYDGERTAKGLWQLGTACRLEWLKEVPAEARHESPRDSGPAGAPEGLQQEGPRPESRNQSSPRLLRRGALTAAHDSPKTPERPITSATCRPAEAWVGAGKRARRAPRGRRRRPS